MTGRHRPRHRFRHRPELPFEECIGEPTGELVDLTLVMVRDGDRWQVVFTEPA